ncbi:unnamed protein product [Pipistrellus nathusii]|uniref:Uncharacterized protein n=1 Tax=Pipistrellus nathusii TaxID=59473 RepID=A0ABN9ZVF5_PIPNA
MSLCLQRGAQGGQLGTNEYGTCQASVKAAEGEAVRGLRFPAGNRSGPRGPGRPAPRADAAGPAVRARSWERRWEPRTPRRARVDAQAELPPRGPWSQSWP